MKQTTDSAQPEQRVRPRNQPNGQTSGIILVRNSQEKLETVEMQGISNCEQTIKTRVATLDKIMKQAYDMSMLALTLSEC